MTQKYTQAWDCSFDQLLSTSIRTRHFSNTDRHTRPPICNHHSPKRSPFLRMYYRDTKWHINLGFNIIIYVQLYTDKIHQKYNSYRKFSAVILSLLVTKIHKSTSLIFFVHKTIFIHSCCIHLEISQLLQMCAIWTQTCVKKTLLYCIYIYIHCPVEHRDVALVKASLD